MLTSSSKLVQKNGKPRDELTAFFCKCIIIFQHCALAKDFDYEILKFVNKQNQIPSNSKVDTKVAI